MVNLVIVESPTKVAPIKKYLGSNYKVIASKGHVRDLPKSSFGVDIENGFEPHYINIRGKGDVIKEIRKEAKAAKKVYLATDPACQLQRDHADRGQGFDQGAQKYRYESGQRSAGAPYSRPYRGL